MRPWQATVRTRTAHEGERHEDQEGAVDDRVDPVGHPTVRHLGDVALGVLELHAQDEPDRGHGEPPEDVRHHPSEPVPRALRPHVDVHLAAGHLGRVLDVVEWPVLRQASKATVSRARG